RALRAEGLSWQAIGAKLGFHFTTLRYHADPQYRREQEQRDQARRRARYDYAGSGIKLLPEPEADWCRRMSEARDADDTRSLTGRMFGDPLPGRSALDREGMRR